MQDRSRLLPVAARLVGLGADLDATDAEGRTALHLAAGCGDRTMVLQLVELGSDVNAHDSVGGALETFAYSRPCRTVWRPLLESSGTAVHIQCSLWRAAGSCFRCPSSIASDRSHWTPLTGVKMREALPVGRQASKRRCTMRQWRTSGRRC